MTNDLTLQIGNECIDRKHCVKFLGMYIDDNLNWQEHINICKSKLSSALYVINKTKRLLNKRCLKTIYYSLVFPHLTYGIILWGSTYDSHLNKLIIMQKKLIRGMANVSNINHAEPLFQEPLEAPRYLHSRSCKIHF